MKTIVFFSLKGGTGKSLAVANLGLLLSRLGINSALVDLDFDGPSLYNKFRNGPPPDKKNILNYILNAFGDVGEIDFWPKKYPHAITVNPGPGWKNLDDCSIAEHAERENEEDLDPSKRDGLIHLLPAGNILAGGYGTKAQSPFFQGVLNPIMEYNNGRITRDSLSTVMSVFKDFKEAVSELEPRPDYMIVDMRSGSLSIVSTILGAWAQAAVYMFTFNDESIAYTIEKFADRSKMSLWPETVEFIPVLSRIPQTSEYRGDRALNDLLAAFGITYKDLCVLHSDRDVEAGGRLRLGHRQPPLNVQLSQDYLRLFERVMVREHVPEEGLQKRVQLPVALRQLDRYFSLESGRGALINPNDNSRNVSFKVETFQMFLQGLEKAFPDFSEESEGNSSEKSGFKMKEGSDLHPNKEDAKGDRRDRDVNAKGFVDALHYSGLKCGEKFGLSLRREWSNATSVEAVPTGDQAKLEQWCLFDSDVGFGHFSLVSKTIKILGGLREVEVVLRESFLTPGRDIDLDGRNDHGFCSFITGYVKGVISKILNLHIHVVHNRLCGKRYVELFGDADPRSESCLFTITVEGYCSECVET